MKRLATLLLALGTASASLLAASPGGPRVPLPPVRVSANGHNFELPDGRPFFWLGDTAWQLIHDATPDEAAFYLRTRARQGFTVIQAVVLAEMDGLNRPNQLGDRPFFDNDPGRPNSAYFKHVVSIIDRAAAEGLYVAVVPTWGDKLTAPWGAGPRIFTTGNLPAARAYGEYLGELLKERTNVLWLMGGDRPARMKGLNNAFLNRLAREAGFPEDVDWTPIWREMAEGIASRATHKPVFVFHPQGGPESSSTYLHHETWISVNGMQSGHGGGHDVPVWEWITRDYTLTPAKPTLDLEPNYEDHPYNPWPKWDPATGYFRDHDVRKQTYRSVFAGGCGVTYGHHAVWQMAGKRRDPVNYPDRDWVDALWRPAARQMQFLRWLVESRPWGSRVPDQTLIVGDAGKGARHLRAMRDEAGSYAFVYFPENDQEAKVDATRLAAKTLKAWWYDPRTGAAQPIGEFPGRQHLAFKSLPYGPDWVLVLDDAAKSYSTPGWVEGSNR